MQQEAVPDIDIPIKCPSCNSSLVNSDNELVCSKCGLVINILDKYIASYDQKYNSQEDHYCGSIIPGNDFATNISQLQKNILFSSRRKENELKWIIDKICDGLHLGSSIKIHSYKMGLTLLRNLCHSNRKLNLAAIAAYSVVTAARFYNMNIVPHYRKVQLYLQSIGFKIRTKDLFRVILNAKEIGLEGIRIEAGRTINEIISVIIRSNKRLQKLKLEEREIFLNNLRTISIRLFNDLKSNHYYFRSKNPVICLASTIYAASKEAASILNVKNPITQRELAGYVGYAEYSVRETYEVLFGKNVNKTQNR